MLFGLADPLLASPVTLLGVNPAPGAVLSNLVHVTVTFSAAVNGPAAEDLLVNGNPAASVVGDSNRWTFSFSQPTPGQVAFSWDGSHAIYDLAGNRFDELDAGSTWSYRLVDTLAPELLSISPTPGATVRALNRIEVVFKETITGLKAADLLVNGQPAAGVTGSGVGPYLFSFPPASGTTVEVAWAGSQTIVDTAERPNPFGGGVWNYTLNPALAADVVINELLADNLNGLLDEDGDTSDWIELYNRGSAAVNLLGWALTDDPGRPGQWIFPAITLDPGQFLVVFASGKDRAPGPGGRNHVNFTLAPSEYLGLYDAQLPRNVVSEFAPAYPEQRGDIAWGRINGDGGTAYFSAPTPGAPNQSAVSYTAVAERPQASVDSGLFAAPFQVTLSSRTAGAAIYYTLNGDVPTPSGGILYTNPIHIDGTAAKSAIPLRAAAYQAGLLPSTILTRTYIFPDRVLQQPIAPPGFPTNWISGLGKLTTSGDYEMDPQVLTNGANRQIARQALMELPVVSLVASVNTFFAPTTGVYTARIKQGNQKAVNVQMWRPNGQEIFQADCGFEIQGGSSPSDSGSDWKDKKLSMRLVFKGDFGTPKLEARVFEDTPVEEFNTLILDAGLNYWWTHMTDGDQRNRAKFITDQFTSDLMNNAGMVAQHGRFVHLFLNGLYWGLYDLHERMDEAAAASYFGGDKEQYDVLKHTGDVAGLQNGTLTAYTDLMRIAQSGVVTNLAAYERLASVLDLPWLADYLIVNFYVGNTDWPNHNWYAWRRTRGPAPLPWRFVSWDAEHTVKSYSENRLGVSDVNSPGQLFQILRNNREFKTLFADRIHHLMFNGGPLYSLPNRAAFWSPTNRADNIPADTYRKRVDEIWNSIVCESARWGDVASPTAPYTRELHYTRELNSLYSITNAAGQTPNYFPLRGSNVLAQFRSAGLYPTNAAPVFSQHGGRVPPGFLLYITNLQAAGTLYYTINGTDPRSYGSGAPAPGALIYSNSPVALDQSTIVKARLQVGTNWSALNEAAFTVGTLGVPLRITEIMFAPPAGPAPSGAYEFLELWNAGRTDLPLGGYSFQGITFAFAPSYVLPAGTRVVLASDQNPAAFAARYPGVPVSDYFGGSLNNAGERIAILDPAGRIVVSVDYSGGGNGWPAAANGAGYSLELIDPNGNPDDPANWRASTTRNGSPGLPPANRPPPDLRINEVMADNLTAFDHAGTHPDWIELFNAGSSPVDLTGWSLTDNSDPRRFVFTAGPVVAPAAYLVVFFDTNATPGIHTGFGLNKESGRVLLYDPATNRVDALSLGAQLPDYSVGLFAGTWLLSTPTPGAPNVTAPTAEPSSLVLNEWLANARPGGSDWVELHNRSSLPAAIHGIYLGTADTVFRYLSLSFIPPGGFVLLFADNNPGISHLDFKLAAAGGDLVLFDAAGSELDRIHYGAQAEGVTEGRWPNGAGTIVSFPNSPSPGAANYLPDQTGPVLNEILARNQSGGVSPWGARSDWVEIANPTANPIDVGGFGLSDQPGPPKFRVPSGTVLAANGYLRIWCDDETGASSSSSADLNTGFALSARSGAVYLSAPGGAVVDSVQYGFQAADFSIGRTDGGWRLLARPTPSRTNGAPASLGSPSSLRFNEWQSAPARGNDWFELFNQASQPVELSGLYLTDDPSLYGVTKFQVKPLSFVGPRGYAVFEADGDSGQGDHHVNFRLAAGGDALRLYASDLTPLDAVELAPQSPGTSAGRLPDGASTLTTFTGSSTPGESNYRPLPNVIINEVLQSRQAPFEDAIELYNPTETGIDIGGWFLSNDAANPAKYRIPNSTFLAAGGYATFYYEQFGAPPAGFPLKPMGSQVLLSEADANGALSGYRAVAHFDPAPDATSFGRIDTCTGVDFAPLQRPTLGVQNPASTPEFRTGAGMFNGEPKVGPIVITEINPRDEYIELHNAGATSISLFDPAAPARTWRLRQGIQFSFPSGVSIGPGAFILIVGFDPVADPGRLAAFRQSFAVPPDVEFYGPYSGKLDNETDTIEVAQPGRPVAPSELVPYQSRDRLTYDMIAGWPTNSAGVSLQRRSPLAPANDSDNWVAASPTAGQATAPEPPRAPTVVVQPVSRTVPPGARVVFSVSICGSRPLSYQWKRNGTEITGATESALVLPQVDMQDAGSYSVEISNAAGRVTSLPAALSLGSLPQISVQPQSQSVREGGTITFAVQAQVLEPLTYQWRHQGQPLPGATGDTLTLANVQLEDAGGYSVLVANVVGAIASAVANLTVLAPPRITLQPQSQSVSSNGTATFTVIATGMGVVRYQWQRNGVDLTGATNSTLVIQNAQLTDEADYRVITTDDVTSGISQVAHLTVRVPPIIVSGPVGVTNVAGSTLVFNVQARGSVPMSFRWLRMSIGVVTNILNSTSDSLIITNAQPSHSGLYRLVLTNSGNLNPGVTLSWNVLIVAPPVIGIQPLSQTVNAGTSVLLSASVTGTLPIAYQWLWSGLPLAGATNASLLLPNVQTLHQGSYQLVATNLAGRVVSEPAILTVIGPPTLQIPQWLANGDLRLGIAGMPDRSYTIEVSPDLQNWTALTTLAYTNGIMPFTDPGVSSRSNRFYRARQTQ